MRSKNNSVEGRKIQEFPEDSPGKGYINITK